MIQREISPTIYIYDKIKAEGYLRRKSCWEQDRKSRNRKINFVTTWDPMFPDINKAFRKFYHILEEDEQCKNYFYKGRLEFRIKEVTKI